MTRESFPRQVASVVLRMGAAFQEPPSADARWAELKAYLDANIRQARSEAADWADAGADELAGRLRRNAEVLGMVRAHMGEIEDERGPGIWPCGCTVTDVSLDDCPDHPEGVRG